MVARRFITLMLSSGLRLSFRLAIASAMLAASVHADTSTAKPAAAAPTPQSFQALFRVWNFDHQQAGEPPLEFSAHGIGNASAAWKIMHHEDAPSQPNVVIPEASCPGGQCLQALLADGLTYEYLDVAIRMKHAGEVRGAGGIVIGAKDPQNFYAALVDFGRDTLEFLKVLDGKPTVLGRAALKPSKFVWHLLRVQRNTIISKDFIEVAVDGTIRLSIEDKDLGAGQIGLITRGEAQIQFDNLHAAPLYSQRPLSPPPAY